MTQVLVDPFAQGADRGTLRYSTSTPRLVMEPVQNTVLQRMGTGDQTAVDDCMSAYGNLVWSLALRLTGSRSDAEDATQEIFLELWRCADRFDPSKASEAGFIAMLARRRLIDMMRKKGRQPLTEELPIEDLFGGSDDPAGASQAGMDAVSIAATQALGQLRPEQKQVIELSVYHGMSHDEISTKINMPLGTVKTHARRGLIKLREMLGDGPMAAPQEVRT